MRLIAINRLTALIIIIFFFLDLPINVFNPSYACFILPVKKLSSILFFKVPLLCILKMIFHAVCNTALCE